MTKNRVYVAGHKGMVGSSILNLLSKQGENKLITKSHSQLDLTKQTAVINF